MALLLTFCSFSLLSDLGGSGFDDCTFFGASGLERGFASALYVFTFCGEATVSCNLLVVASVGFGARASSNFAVSIA